MLGAVAQVPARTPPAAARARAPAFPLLCPAATPQAAQMPDLPEFVYLITVDGEWPVSARAGDHPTTPGALADEVKRRTTGRNVQATDRAHIWRVPVKNAVEMEIIPEQKIPASMQEKTDIMSDLPADATTAYELFQDCYQQRTKPWDDLSPREQTGWRRFDSKIRAQAAAAERERIRQLAIEHNATYTHSLKPCNPGQVRHPFADLLDGGTP
jgi:hypothetical protein